MDELFKFLPLFLVVGLLFGLWWLIKFRKADRKLITWLDNPIRNYALLIVLTIIGFIALLDNTQAMGCITGNEKVFSQTNILYSLTAVVLLSIGVFLPNKSIGSIFLILELLIWLYKLFFFKGGYAVGIAGVPSFNVLIFDAVTLALRMLLIKQLAHLSIRVIVMLSVVLFILILKIQFFQSYFLVE